MAVRTNPQIITLARDARAWSQSDLAKAINSRQGTISKYELGLIEVPDRELESIARVLDFDLSLFRRNDPLFCVGGDFLYRRKARMSMKSRRRVQAEANILLMSVENLTKSVELSPRFELPAITPDSVGGRAEDVARAVREALRIPDGPIRNLTRIIEQAGAIVFRMKYESGDIDGTNIRIAGCPPLLFLNDDVPGDRYRFSLAHELGHVVMHSTIASDDVESEANEFASEFLMPKRLIARDLRNFKLSDAPRLKQVWGVAMQALVRRARTLRTISESAYKRMMIDISASGMRLREPYPVPQECPESYERLIEEHRKIGYTEEDLRAVTFTQNLGPIPVPDVPKLRLVDEPKLW